MDPVRAAGVHHNEVVKHLEELQTRGLLDTKSIRGEFIYRGRQDSTPSVDG